MKRSQSIGLFFVVIFIILSTGLVCGFWLGTKGKKESDHKNITQEAHHTKEDSSDKKTYNEKDSELENAKELKNQEDSLPAQDEEGFSEKSDRLIETTVNATPKLRADTEFILREQDIDSGNITENAQSIPSAYIGMDRALFTKAMERYSASPPLAEREKGFVGLEILSFSDERVVVRKDYSVPLSERSFYLALLNHQVVALFDDKKTIFLYTGIMDEEISEEVRKDLMNMIYVENEADLFALLESYTS